MPARRWWSVGLSWLPLAMGCSYVEVPYPGSGANGTAYAIGRTMELGNVLGITKYSIEVVPASDSTGQFSYVALMNVFGMMGAAKKVPFEGINEAGLTISALALSESVYEDMSEGAETELREIDVVAAVLANCDSVKSALDFLSGLHVVKSPPVLGVAQFGGVHWAIADSAGRSVAVEYLQGQRVVSENGPRVLTNDPNLQWHWRHLNQFPTLTPEFPHQDFLSVETDHGVGAVPRTIGHGWNLFGLPGDTSPPSRFVKLFFLRGFALHAAAMKTAEDAITLASALLNTVFIPFGTVAPEPAAAPVDRPEYTPYSVIKLPADGKLLVRSYRNTQWRLIDLRKLDLTKPYTWPVEDGTLGVADITHSGELAVPAASTVV